MRLVKVALVLSALAGVVVLEWQQHRRTQQKLDETQRKLDELAAALAARAPESAPAPVELKVPPPGQVPRELDKITLPPYIIEAPDQLFIEAVRRNPKTNTTDRLPVQPISGPFQVRMDGTVGLGYWGSVSVTGLTIDQATEAVQRHLANMNTLKEELTSGATLLVIVDVLTHNSKQYYIITNAEKVITNAEKGEEVYSFPITGNETVLDAVAKVPGLAAAKPSIHIARRTASGEVQTLPVDWQAITQEGITTTNYQILAGDRVYATKKRLDR
jgi:polysaccharide export outer membrane protein